MSQEHSPDEPLVMERLGRLQDADRSFDVEFWQRQGPTAIFAAAWQMAIDAYRWKGQGDAERPFQRTVERLQRLRS